MLDLVILYNVRKYQFHLVRSEVASRTGEFAVPKAQKRVPGCDESFLFQGSSTLRTTLTFCFIAGLLCFSPTVEAVLLSAWFVLREREKRKASKSDAFG